MKRSKSILLSCLALAVTLCGCASSNTSQSNQPSGRDTVYIKVEPDGYNEVKAGERFTRSFSLQDEGDLAVFTLNEPVELCFGDLDSETETIQTTIDQATKVVQMRVVSRANNTVKFVTKCQTVIYSTLAEIPKIEVTNGLSPQQIVITPLCDESGMIYAYELRYGSEEQGCRKQAGPGLEAFKRCPGVVSFRPVSIDRGSYFGRASRKGKKR